MTTLTIQQKIAWYNNEIEQAKKLAEYFAKQQAPYPAAVQMKRYQRLAVERQQLWQATAGGEQGTPR